MGQKSLVITGFPIEEKERAFSIIPKEKWFEVVEKNDLVFCKNDYNWRWNETYEDIGRWYDFMNSLEEKEIEEDKYFTLVIGENWGVNFDSSVNPETAFEYGFEVVVNSTGSIFQKPYFS